ncbi:hypothetical protein AKJ63_01460 [candidate division MSBL1 archaeon SCGC-AAA259D18]|uniref:Transposase IS66 zinc-finger binding domain-containing protein n=1 Tax=candidate division MSBL1 archaeon SCGC-AAA259D18 TaxID=1698262 RepID=A0A133UB68_9EURY|nr:hypothetical protein AKJ63_01460 [candidate division MSBL1 archaeon SCGC-AAA259D18]
MGEGRRETEEKGAEKKESGEEDAEREDEENEGKGKPGRKPGHEPAWREQPEPDETIEVPLDNCVHCGGELGDPSGKKTSLVTDIPDPEPLKTTEFKLHCSECPHCGEENVATHPDCSDEGEYGPNTLVQATLFKHEERLPNRKTADLLETLRELHRAQDRLPLP